MRGAYQGPAFWASSAAPVLCEALLDQPRRAMVPCRGQPWQPVRLKEVGRHQLVVLHPGSAALVVGGEAHHQAVGKGQGWLAT